MALPEYYYAVLLYGQRVGTLCQRGDHTRFVLTQDYLENSDRPVLGLRFEERLGRPYSSALRLPKWFSNLLPEGPLREWIAADRHVSLDREMELLAQVGHDLPGAVQVLPADGPDDAWEWSGPEPDAHKTPSGSSSPWRFSLAGVALKFSMLARGDRLTVPAVTERGDWLVKFPDYKFADVPRNEYAMMRIAASCGINVPEVRLVHRDELDGLPERMWPNAERWAYAVKRFDRTDDGRTLVHIEDFAQVQDIYPQQKYEGSFETVAALSYRGRDHGALREFTRRLAFCVLLGNGDAHLKNWSLIYLDKHIPTLAPAYDLVSTVCYRDYADGPEDLGLKFQGSTRFDAVQLSSFEGLGRRLGSRFGSIDIDLVDIVVATARRAQQAWQEHGELLKDTPALYRVVDGWLRRWSTRLGG